jgi:nucleotide-binding universal stress UspA family protein
MERIARAFNFCNESRTVVTFAGSPVSRRSAKPSVISVAQDVIVPSDSPSSYPFIFPYSLSSILRITAHRTKLENAARLNISKHKRAATHMQRRLPTRQIVTFVKKRKVERLLVGLRKRNRREAFILSSMQTREIRLVPCPVPFARGERGST